jgi:phospholipase D1/2
LSSGLNRSLQNDIPTSEPVPRVPLGLVLRFLALVAIIGGGFALLRWSPLAHYVSPKEIPQLLARLRGTWWAPLLLFAAYAVLSPIGFPASPLMVAGGAVFGTVLGTAYNLFGLLLGASTTYALGRLLGRDLVIHIAGKQVKRVERVILRQGGFWGMVGIRFVPAPFALTNYCAAFAGIPYGLFVGSTAVGLAITTPVYTYFADILAHAASGARTGIYLQFAGAILLLIIATLSPRILRARKRRQRYRQILAMRAVRPRSAPSPPPSDR